MIRTMIQIEEEKCNGCALCADACHEGAIAMVDGKAKLIREDYCDGLGDCLPSCPTGAITLTEQEALPYDEAAVQAHLQKQQSGCPSAHIQIHPQNTENSPQKLRSELRQWPIQIKLAPFHAPYFDGANLLIAADCTAYAYANFHQEFIKNHITLIGCPKLDMEDYAEKLFQIISANDIKSLKVVRMEVPCCGGIEHAAKEALQKSEKFIPWQIMTVTTDGTIL